MPRCEKLLSIPLCSGKLLNSYLLDLIESDLVVRSIVKLGGARALVSRQCLGVFQGVTIVEIGGNACCAKRVIAGVSTEWGDEAAGVTIDPAICRRGIVDAMGVAVDCE